MKEITRRCKREKQKREWKVCICW